MKEDRLSNVAIINSTKNEIESCETYLKLLSQVSSRKVEFFSSKMNLIQNQSVSYCLDLEE